MSKPTAVQNFSTTAIRTIELSKKIDLINLLPNLSSNEVFSWVRNNQGIVAWGINTKENFTGSERFSRAHRWWKEFVDNSSIRDEVQTSSSGAIAFVSFSYLSENSSVVVVPEIVVGQNNEKTWLTVIGNLDIEKIKSEIYAPREVPKAPSNLTWSDGTISIIDWQKGVEKAVERINNKELDKVVLARDLNARADENLDSRYLLNKLSDSYPECWTFSVDGLVGATPELLIRRNGDSVLSRVLAGTIKRDESATDSELATTLLQSGKDLDEHEFAVSSVATSLALHCTDMNVPKTPKVLRLANVAHLATDISGTLVDAAPALVLAGSLHPSAAICGTPTGRAKSLIQELEQMDRNRYTGPVGWINSKGDGELGIALRCAEIKENTARLFAGCGIVSGSTPEDELIESNAKFSAMRDALTN
ncbi:MAG: isochorismate synthase [Candidatus Nanopelagicales bacterium]|nr:isochorismate synthase [Candidatus Nanopelagicales bacterium]